MPDERPSLTPIPDPLEEMLGQERPVPPEGQGSERYVEGELLGAGGAGTVFAGRDTELHRDVAIKRLRDVHADDATVARFVGEAQIASQLEHPNIVPIYDVQVGTDGQPFFVMKRIRGQSLADAAPTLSLLSKLDVFRKVCDAVSYAHSHGVLHRDLKPANVMIGPFGEVYVMDWGLAKILDVDAAPITLRTSGGGDAQQTVAGEIAGTPAYMAPEQTLGRTDAIGVAVDIYALGALLYFLVTGTAPVSGTAAEAIVRVRDGTFPRPRDVVRGIPDELETVVLKAMARLPSGRYASAQALRDDIQLFLEHRPLAARTYTRGELVLKWMERHRTSVRISAVAALVMMIAGSTGAVRYIRGITAARNAALAAEAEAHDRWIDSEIALAMMSLESGRADLARSHLANLAERPANGESQLRAELVEARMEELFPPPLVSWRAPQPFDFGGYGSAISGHRVIVGLVDTIHVVDLASGEVLRSPVGKPTPEHAVGFVEDHAAIIDREGDAWVVRDLVTGTARASFAFPAEYAVFASDGNHVFLYGSSSGVRRYDSKTGLPAGPRIPWANRVRKASADGRWAALFSSERSDLGAKAYWVTDMATGRRSFFVGETALAFSPARGQLVSGGDDGLQMRDLEDGETVWERPFSGASSCGFPDEETLYCSFHDGMLRWFRADDGVEFDARPFGTRREHESSEDGLLFTSNGSEIAFWSLAPGAHHVGDETTSAMAASEDGVLVATGDEASITLWDQRSGAALRSYPRSYTARALSFDSTGRWLAIAEQDAVDLIDPVSGTSLARTLLDSPRSPRFRGNDLWALSKGSLVRLDGALGAVERVDAGITLAWDYAFTPDLRTACIVGRTAEDPALVVVDLDAREVTCRSEAPGPAYAVAAHPDGSVCLVGDQFGQAQAFDVDTCGVSWTLPMNLSPVLSAAFSHDGRVLATGSFDGGLRLYDTASRAEVAVWRVIGGISGLVFNEDRSLLALTAQGVRRHETRPRSLQAPAVLGQPLVSGTVAERAAEQGNWALAWRLWAPESARLEPSEQTFRSAYRAGDREAAERLLPTDMAPVSRIIWLEAISGR